MPLITAQTVSEIAVELLARTIVLPQTVTRVPNADYRGSGGRTLVRVPQRLAANQQTTRGAAIVYSDLNELAVEVDLDHWYAAAKLSDEALTLDVRDFAGQVIAPLVAAVAEAGEDRLATQFNRLPADLELDPAATADETRDVVLRAREQLVAADIPATGRYLAVSPSFATRLFAVADFVRADARATTDAITNATLGTLFGLQVVESSALADGTAVAYHRSAAAFATLAPTLPQGAASARTSTVQGVALRTLFDFDPGTLSDVIAVSTFGGAAITDSSRLVKIAITEGSGS